MSPFESRILPATTEGTVDYDGGFTWYRITGELKPDERPLIVLHGGPGCTHDYLLRLAQLSLPEWGGRAVIHYDQIGNGHSSHHPDKPAEYWNVDLFVAEFHNLLAHLGITEYDILGQSWGGMLGSEIAIRRPAGLHTLVLADSPASIALWLEAANRLRAQLPPGVDETLKRHEDADTTDSPEYLDAMKVYYDLHVCRVVPNPPEVKASLDAMDADPTVYMTMNGPSEFYTIGSLVDWTVVDRIKNITARTLVVSGFYDEATPETVRPFVDSIPDARWRLFSDSSHMPHVEETERYLRVVRAFLDGDEPEADS
jgi:L-proline amide hydrolase